MSKKGLCMVVLAMMGAMLFMSGCETGSKKSDEEHTVFTFINDTNKRIQITRAGGEDWVSSETFQLVGRGAERSVELKEKGKIGYTYTVLDSGDVSVDQDGSQIIFKY